MVIGERIGAWYLISYILYWPVAPAIEVVNKFTAAPVQIEVHSRPRQAAPVPYTICNKCYRSMPVGGTASMHIECMEDKEQDEETKTQK